jgi:hypothetical protein
MNDVRIDEAGSLRCWNCGSNGFDSKRTTRSKMLVGVGALVTQKKLKCQSCGEYNQTGNAQPFDSTTTCKAVASVTPAKAKPTSFRDAIRQGIEEANVKTAARRADR